MCFAIATITRSAKTPLMVSGPIFPQAQLKSCRTALREKWGAWIGSIVGFLLVLLSWPVTAQSPFPVVTGLSNPSALALDGNYIYFGENPGFTGHLSRALKTGGPREQLLTGKALHDSGSLVGILGIDFSPTHIYFGYGGYVNTLIEELPRSGSTTRVLANLSGSSSAGRFSGVLGSNIYYFQNFCNLQRLGTAIGATPVQVASCVWPRSTARDQNSLYFFDLNSRNVYRYDAGTVNSLVPLITGNASEGAVFLDSTNVYFAVGALVRKVAKLGGTVTNIALPAGGVMRQADDAFIYFTVGTQLWRQASVGSGSAEIVSSGISISGDMVSDATFLYWADMSAGNGAGVINRLRSTVPGPSIVSVVPSSGPAGTAVTIAGANFGPPHTCTSSGPPQDTSFVTFGLNPATMIISWCDSQVVVIAPANGNATGPLPVTAQVGVQRSNQVTFAYTTATKIESKCEKSLLTAVQFRLFYKKTCELIDLLRKEFQITSQEWATDAMYNWLRTGNNEAAMSGLAAYLDYGNSVAAYFEGAPLPPRNSARFGSALVQDAEALTIALEPVVHLITLTPAQFLVFSIANTALVVVQGLKTFEFGKRVLSQQHALELFKEYVALRDQSRSFEAAREEIRRNMLETIELTLCRQRGVTTSARCDALVSDASVVNSYFDWLESQYLARRLAKSSQQERDAIGNAIARVATGG